jgi:hypothetical protein
VFCGSDGLCRAGVGGEENDRRGASGRKGGALGLDKKGFEPSGANFIEERAYGIGCASRRSEAHPVTEALARDPIKLNNRGLLRGQKLFQHARWNYAIGVAAIRQR